MHVEGYESLVLVGSGGNAHVYKATQEETGKTVAVKVLRGGGSEAVSRRFERERLLMESLEKIDNIVPILDWGVTEAEDPYLVMPFYAGGSLEDEVLSGPMPWRDAVEITRKLAESVALAHAKRVVHLDIKPANVLLSNEGEPWLADFGIAEVMGHAATMSARMITPIYCPPERFNGAKPGELTDLYALTATLFALLAGAPPYVTPEMTAPMDVMRAITNEPVPVGDLPVDTPTSVINLIERGMAKNPADRPQSAIRLTALLEDVLAGRSVAAPSPVSIANAVPLKPVAKPKAAAPRYLVSMDLTIEPIEYRLQNQSRRPLVAAVLTAALIIGALGIALAETFADDGIPTASGVVTDRSLSEPATLDAISTPQRDDAGVAREVADGGEEPTTPEVTEEVPQADVEADSADSALEDTDQTSSPSLDTLIESSVEAAEVVSASDEAIAEEPAAPVVVSGEDAPEPAPQTTEATTTTTVAPAPTTTTSTTSTTPRTAPSTELTTTAPLTIAPTVAGPTTSIPKAELEAEFFASSGLDGSEQTLSFISVSVGEASVVTWDFGDGTVGTGERVSHTYANPGQYVVTITVSGPDGTDTARNEIRVASDTSEVDIPTDTVAPEALPSGPVAPEPVATETLPTNTVAPNTVAPTVAPDTVLPDTAVPDTVAPVVAPDAIAPDTVAPIDG